MNVVITGGSRGLGKSLAKSFVKRGDNVTICSRNPLHLRAACIELQTLATTKNTHARIDAFVADVSNAEEMATSCTAPVDIWIHNAGYNGYTYTQLLDQDPAMLRDILTTNLLGTAISYQQALRCGATHIFCMMGGGSSGEATPSFAMYGASKRGAYHLVDSLRIEAPSHVHIHRIFPGFVNTPLLTTGLPGARAMTLVDAIARDPDDVAGILVPAIHDIVDHNRSSRDLCVNSLTFGACMRLVTGAIFNVR